MNSCEFVHLISSLACVIAQNTSEDELAILATFFTQLGDTLATIAATKSATKPCSTCSSSNTDSDTDSDKCNDTDKDTHSNINSTDSNICQF